MFLMSIPFPCVPLLGSLTMAHHEPHEQAAGLKASLGTAVLRVPAALFRNDLSFEALDMGLFVPGVHL